MPSERSDGLLEQLKKQFRASGATFTLALPAAEKP
jgi:hypothetical protein